MKKRSKEMEVKMINGFNLTKQLQGKVSKKVICGIVGLSPSTVSRFFSCNVFQDYRDYVKKHNEEAKSKRNHLLVLKVGNVVKELPQTPEIDSVIPSKTNDISKMGEITTMSLLNAILGELKKLNSFLEENK